MEHQYVHELYNLRKLKTARTFVESAGSPEIAKLIGEEIERRTKTVTQNLASTLNVQEVEIALALTPREEAFFLFVSHRPRELCSYEDLFNHMIARHHLKASANESHLQPIARSVGKKMANYGTLGVWYKRGYTWYPKEKEADVKPL